MPDASTRIFADNWNIYEASGKDLAITAISQPYECLLQVRVPQYRQR
jgi:hypothetical protein